MIGMAEKAMRLLQEVVELLRDIRDELRDRNASKSAS